MILYSVINLHNKDNSPKSEIGLSSIFNAVYTDSVKFYSFKKLPRKKRKKIKRTFETEILVNLKSN